MPTISEAIDLALQYQQSGNFRQAESIYHQILQLDPGHAEALHFLGVLAYQVGRHELAIEYIGKAIRAEPGQAAYHTNLANALHAHGQLDEAVAAFQEALQLRPNYPLAHNNLGNVLKAQGHLAEAGDHYREALRLKPDFAEAHSNLGALLKDQGSISQALTHFHEAVRYNPACTEAHVNLALTLGDQGRFAEAVTHYREALRLKPSNGLRIAFATLLPLIYDSVDHLRAVRQNFVDNVRRLQQDQVRIDVTTELAAPCFHLAYQGLNDRDILRDLRSLYVAPAQDFLPALRVKDGAQHKIRVGFISAFFKEHTIGRLMQGLISNLSRQDFIVTVLSAGGHTDAIAQSVQQSADNFVPLPDNLPAARRTVADQNLDMLLYTDIGMDRLTYTLALSRLAPVQCVTWGHPSTTGFETIDYYLSSELFETPVSQEHYTETLVCLKNIPAYCYWPVLPTPRKDRQNFGFADDCHLYSCLQSVFKFHPEFDAFLAGILRADPRGILVLSQGIHPHWHELLRERFALTLPDVLDRVRFVRWQKETDFLNLNAICDVLLDPIHFGGGRTSYEALALGLPIVTLPSQFLRGRMCLGMYKKMNVLDCVAGSPQEYIDIAVRLGTDPEYHDHVHCKILAANKVLFEDMEAVHELEHFFREVRARRRV